MQTTAITQEELFEKGQILTLDLAKKMTGKKIYCTYPQYHANNPDVREVTISSIESEWDLGAKKPYPNNTFKNFQEYWSTYMSPSHIEDVKNKLQIISEGKETYIRCQLGSREFEENTFYCSDANRGVIFLEA